MQINLKNYRTEAKLPYSFQFSLRPLIISEKRSSYLIIKSLDQLNILLMKN